MCQFAQFERRGERTFFLEATGHELWETERRDDGGVSSLRAEIDTSLCICWQVSEVEQRRSSVTTPFLS